MRSSRLRESKSGIKHYSHILFWKSTACLNLVAGFHGRLPLINYCGPYEEVRAKRKKRLSALHTLRTLR